MIRAGLEKAASGFAGAGRDAHCVASLQIEHVHLVKRITFLALALKNQFAAVWRKISFPAAPPLEDQLARIRDEARLLIGFIRSRHPRDGQREREN